MAAITVSLAFADGTGTYSAATADRAPLLRALREASAGGAIGVDGAADGALKVGGDVTKAQFDVLYEWLHCDRKKQVRCGSMAEFLRLSAVAKFIGMDELPADAAPILVAARVRAVRSMDAEARKIVAIIADLCPKAVDAGVFEVNIWVTPEQETVSKVATVVQPQHVHVSPVLFRLFKQLTTRKTMCSILSRQYDVQVNVSEEFIVPKVLQMDFAGQQLLNSYAHFLSQPDHKAMVIAESGSHSGWVGWSARWGNKSQKEVEQSAKEGVKKGNPGCDYTIVSPAPDDAVMTYLIRCKLPEPVEEDFADMGALARDEPAAVPAPKRPRLDREDLDGKSKAELQKLCQQHGVDKGGTKAELVARLLQRS